MSAKSLEVINEIMSPYRVETSAGITDEVIKDYVRSFGFMEDVLHFSKTAFVIVEYENLSYIHVSSNTMEVLGWPTKKFKDGGPVLGLSCLHPDDLKIQ